MCGVGGESDQGGEVDARWCANQEGYFIGWKMGDEGVRAVESDE